MTTLRLPTASYNQPGRNSARLLNCYAEQSTGKTPVNIVGAPGIVTQTVLTGGGRGLHVFGDTLLAVAGSSLCNALTGDVLGDVGANASRVTFASTATELVTDTGYFYDGTTVSPLTDPDKVPWATVDYSDGRAVFVERDTGRFGATGLNALSAMDALDYATAEGSPDKLVSLIVDHRQVVLFGTASTEIWWNAGAEGFPYERMSSGFLEIGALSRLGRTKADNSVFWLASDRTARRLTGSTPVRVSQHGVEDAWSTYSVVNDCECLSFTWNGHIFVAFSFPTEGKTWLFDVTTNEWHERESYHREAWDVVSTAEFNGKVYAQHRDGSVGYFSDVRREFGESFLRQVTWPAVTDGKNNIIFPSQFDAILRTGHVASGIVPRVTLEVSHDDGHTFHTLPIRELGRTGEYANVVRWTRLGSGLAIVFRLTSADDAEFCLTDAVLS